jgi:uncharacterized protein
MEVTFSTNSDCNLACKYCYEVGKKKQILSFDKAKKFIDLILDEDPLALANTRFSWVTHKGIILDFIGGDSLMHPDLIDQILIYFITQATIRGHRYARNWRASISTNGTLFGNPAARKLIEKYNSNLSIGISFDGSPRLHNLNRIFPSGEGSFDAIMKDWGWFKSVRGRNALVTKATLAKESIPYIYESLVFMHEQLGLEEIDQNFIFEDMHLKQEDLDLLDSQLATCTEYLLAHSNEIYWSMFDRQQFAEAKPYDDTDEEKLTACGAGLMPTLSPEGDIYPCFRFLPITTSSGVSRYNAGSLDQGLDKEKFAYVRSQTKDKISPAKCKTCPIESACKWCIGGAYSQTGRFERQTYICEVIKLQVKWARIYWERFDNNKKEA